MSLIKSQLIQNITDQNPHLYIKDVERIVNTIFETISLSLENGDRIELRGFGAFSVREHGARKGRNPRTGEPVDVARKQVPYFKMGKGMRERLNK